MSILSPLALTVIVIVGSSDAKENFHSHAEHVRQLGALLADRGVPPERFTVFWADGVDPGPDRSIRLHGDVENAWILGNTAVDGPTAPRLSEENTIFEGLDVRPARRDAIQRWMRTRGAALSADDTLLVVVTGHGHWSAEGDRDGRIPLWGRGTWSRTQMAEDLSEVPEGVRVVLWMSQCYSGGFADLHAERDGLCGAFASGPHEVSYGCHPLPDIGRLTGHFERMVDAFRRHDDLSSASDEVMLTDDAPDRPHLTSDAFLRDALVRIADEKETTVADLLGTPEEVPPLALRIADAHGLPPPDDPGEVLGWIHRLEAAVATLESWEKTWSDAMDVIRQRLAEPLVSRLDTLPPLADDEARLALRAELVQAARSAAEETGTWETLDALRARHRAVGTSKQALNLHLAAVRRVSHLLAREGVVHLDESDRRTWERLRRCETESLLPGATPGEPPVPSLGSVADALTDKAALRPGRMGVSYVDTAAGAGPVRIEAVDADGPAAGILETGDVVQAVNDQPLVHPGAFWHAVLLAPDTSELNLTVARNGEARALAVPVGAPEVPGRRYACGDALTDLPLEAVAGELPRLGAGTPVVLYAWATWCGACRTATPLLKAWAEENDVQVVVVSTEGHETLSQYVERWSMPFPLAHLDADLYSALSVRAIPAFVVVDARGRLSGIRAGLRGGDLPLSRPDGPYCLPEPS
jgi:thiol-disulfide isomerase/thioredoxin